MKLGMKNGKEVQDYPTDSCWFRTEFLARNEATHLMDGHDAHNSCLRRELGNIANHGKSCRAGETGRWLVQK